MNPDPTNPPVAPSGDGGAADMIILAMMMVVFVPMALILFTAGLLWWSGRVGKKHRNVGLTAGPVLVALGFLMLAIVAGVAGSPFLLVLLLLLAAAAASFSVPRVRQEATVRLANVQKSTAASRH